METEKRLCERIKHLCEIKQPVLVAIDGQCAAGKTTVAEKLGKEFSCNVFHMDDFFLRPEQRTPERYNEPGGNVDRERFLSQVLLPLKSGKPFSYRRFDCRSMSLKEAIEVEPTKVNIIEGTYSCHPQLWDFYDIHVFLTVSKETQISRLSEREKVKLEMFQSKWIPLEEKYFLNCIKESKFDFVIKELSES